MDKRQFRTDRPPRRSRSRVFGALGIASALAVALTAAGTSGASSAKTVTVTIGNVTTLSGAAAQYGNSTTAGAQEAIDEINAKGGVKAGGVTYMFKLASYDDQALPAVAVAQFLKGMSQGEHLFIGPTFGTVSTAVVGQLAGEKAIVTITGGPVLGSLLATAPNAYQTQLDPSGEAQAVLWWLQQQGYHNVVIIADSTSTFDSATFPASVISLSAKYHVNVMSVVGTAGPTQVDYSSQLLSISQKNPDAVISAQTANPNALIVKQARQAGYSFPIISTAGAPTLEYGVAGNAINGTYDIVGITIPTMAANGVAQAQKLSAAYQAKYNATLSDPGGTYGNAYTAVYAYARAIKAAGTATDVTKLEKALNLVRVNALPQIVQNKYIPQQGKKLATLYDTDKLAIPRINIMVWKDGAPVVYATYKG